jgi:nitroimidazol reductase NimA-like FMN-containing flavoprotein (pyridoxamine 5'-phosphate oxidase superfamily)
VAPARTLDERITDTRERLCTDTDAWFASTNGNRPSLVPFSFLRHAEPLIFATMADSPTTGNIRTQQRVRVALGGRALMRDGAWLPQP